MFQKKLKTKDIDLLIAFKKKKEPSKYANLIKFCLPPVILALVIFGVFGFITYKNYSLQADITATNKKIKKFEEKIAKDPNLAKNKTLEGIISNTETYKKLYDNIQSYPQLSQRTFDTLLLAAGTKINISAFAYARESQAITITIESQNASDAELFIRRIKATQEFASVSYTGYASTDKTEEQDTSNTIQNKTQTGTTQTTQDAKTSTVYTATVLCMLK